MDRRQGEAYCIVDKIRLPRDGSRFNQCDARNQDADGGEPDTCEKCTGYRLIKRGRMYKAQRVRVWKGD